MTHSEEQAPAPPVHMSGYCRVACPDDPGQAPGQLADFLHERCNLRGCGCPRHRGRPMTAPFVAWCTFCKLELDEDTQVCVGFKEGASGPGRPSYACGSCLVAYRVIPLAEHPADTDGCLRFRDRGLFAPRSH